ncbi:MAG: type-F conjugative transfer system secretin TraK [Desulfosalsimonadaceae bacterium]
MRVTIKHFIYAVILFWLVGICNANEFYTILFHRGETMESAQEYYDQMLPEIKGKAMICANDGGYNVIYGSFNSQTEATKEAQRLKDGKYVWIEISSFDPFNCIAPNVLNSIPQKNLPPRESFVFPERDFSQKKATPPPPDPPKKQAQINPAPETSTILAYPETVIKCNLSNRYINRIVAPGNKVIKDLIIQKGTGIEVKIEGKNGFITFLKKQDPLSEEIKFQTSPVEIYAVVEPDIIYTIIGQPKDMIAQTVELVWAKNEIEKNLKFFAGLPLEKKIVKMIKTTMANEIPDSFSQTKVGKQIDILKSVNIYFNRLIVAEGEGLILKEYIVSLKQTAEKDQIPVKEQHFLLPELTKKPIGITIEDFTLTKKQSTRVFIVERKES